MRFPSRTNGLQWGVPAAAPRRQPDTPSPERFSSPERHPKPHIYTLEATGLLVVAALLLILTLARFWHHIPWNAR